jgi:flagellar biosynthesis/type III secretory pathway M-ring protein FliF/YscJ
MPAFTLLQRSETPSTSSNSVSNPIYLVGVIVAVVIILVVAAWLGLRAYRKRLAAKREEKMGAAFLSVKGLVRENAAVSEKFPDDSLLQ